jgi:hypothetical protein
MARLAAEVDAINLGVAYKGVYNHVLGTKGSPTVLADVRAARALIAKGLAPTNNRYCILESLGINSIIAGSQALFHPSDAISKQYDQGVVGMNSGFKFYETEMIPTHTMGTFADTDTPIVNTSTGITSGTATIAITSGTTAGTLTAVCCYC